MYPKVAAAKSKGGDDISWVQAFYAVFWSREIKNTNKQLKAPLHDACKTPTAPHLNKASQIHRSPAAEEEKIEIEALQDESYRENDVSSGLGNLEHTNTLNPLSLEPIETRSISSSRNSDTSYADQSREKWQQNVRLTEIYFQNVIENIDDSVSNVRHTTF